uniref:Nucleoside diphosphate kinase A n=1 Tax=Castor canadensis TaxID=51338 RepID=A0A8C0XNP4_CASCN
MTNNERTLIAKEPDGVQQSLVGEIIKQFEHKGVCLVALKCVQAFKDLLKEHYIDLKDHPFFTGLAKYMHSGTVVAMHHTSDRIPPATIGINQHSTWAD